MARDKDKWNAYMRKYTRERYHARRNAAIEHLGGRCVHCGTDEDLQIDHIDPTTKTLDLARKTHNSTEERFWEEIAKCQLLCKPCHIKKSRKERGQEDARETHGTLSSYRYCKCELCKAAKAAYMKEYHRKRREKQKTNTTAHIPSV